MRKKLMSMLLAVCMVFALTTATAFAADNEVQLKSNGTTYSTLADAVANAQSEDTITLLGNVTGRLEVPADKTLTLELGSFTLTADTNDYGAIANRGKLTINGSGSVAGKKGAIANYPGGVMTINGGSYSTESWYTVKNLGTMTINDGVTMTGYAGASLIDNGWYGNAANDMNETYPTSDEVKLTINGGKFTGGMNTIKNDDYGVMTIENGEFSSPDGPAVLNWNKATINGGTFSVDSGHVLAVGCYNNAADAGELTITGGKFYAGSESDTLLGFSPSQNGGKLSVEGGYFEGVLPAGLPYAVEVQKGEFTSDPTAFAAGSATTAKITGTTNIYVAGTPEEVATVAADATGAAGDSIEILKGDADLSGLADQVTVTNSGSGAVSANGVDVAPGGEVVAHNAVKTEAKAPTCTEAGNTEYWYCADCDTCFADEALTTEIEKADTVLAAGHKLVKVEEKAATATAAGNHAYYKCEVCGKLYSDEAGTKEISLASTVIPATGTKPADKPSAAAPTTAADGKGATTTAPKTGYAEPIVLWIALLGVSAAAICISMKKRKEA